jgi:Mg-chelatase subunit ChlI
MSDFTTEKSWPLPSHMISATARGRSRKTSDSVVDVPSTTKFQLCLPFTEENGSTIGLTIREFFNAIIAGRVPLKVLTKPVENPGGTHTSTRSKNWSLRNSTTPNYAEHNIQSTDTHNPDNNEEDEEEEKDNPARSEARHDDDKSVSSKCTSPKKQQTKNKIQLKQKLLQLQHDMNENNLTFQ